MFSTVTENNRPEVPPEADLPGSPGISLAAYRQLMERCWAADAASRPSFKDLVEGFQVGVCMCARVRVCVCVSVCVSGGDGDGDVLESVPTGAVWPSAKDGKASGV